MPVDPHIEAARHARPKTKDHLWDWVRGYTGVSVPRDAVCAGHSAPFDLLAQQFLERPSLALWHGPRGSGKSFNSALDTHLSSRFHPRHGTRILGGSKAQSSQIYEAITEAVIDGNGPLGSDSDTIDRLLKEDCHYVNGSHVKMLAAGPKSVRGPHVPSLKLDEVVEIDEDIREASLGMCKEKHGARASVLMTSTWHKAGGPMSGLIERGRAGEFPTHTYCAFEVLERCPDERSGPALERCGECPLVTWCHADRDSVLSGGLPKAKRSNGHYAIDTLILQVKASSERSFKAEFLCLGPQIQGVWFHRFDDQNVSALAEYEPLLPFHVSIDSGVETGAVLMQVREIAKGVHVVSIFDEHLSYNLGAEAAARDILGLIEMRCGLSSPRRVSTDSAGGARNPMGDTVIATYERVGLKGRRGLEHWQRYPGCILDGLGLVESFVRSADGIAYLYVHPRCVKTIAAFQSYSRDKVSGQWVDYPKDPQHPHEEMIDAVRGGLKLEFPDSRKPKIDLPRVHHRRVF